MTKLRMIFKIWRGAFRLGRQMTMAVLTTSEHSLRGCKFIVGRIKLELE